MTEEEFRTGIKADGTWLMQEQVSLLASDVTAIRGICEQGTQAHGDEFYGRILNILDGKGDDWSPGDRLNDLGQTPLAAAEMAALAADHDAIAEAPTGTFHGQPYYDPPLVVPTAPASGATEVARAAEAAAVAFDNVGNVAPAPEVAPTSDLGGELAKGPAERMAPLPQEGRAQSNAGKFDCTCLSWNGSNGLCPVHGVHRNG